MKKLKRDKINKELMLKKIRSDLESVERFLINDMK